MFINLSNHPTEKWDEFQRREAEKYGEIVDLPFPQIPAEMNSDEVCIQAKKYFSICKAILPDAKVIHGIHLVGEPTFCFYLTNLLIQAGYNVLGSTTERVVKEEGNQKTSIFKFVQFRKFAKEKNKHKRFTLKYCKSQSVKAVYFWGIVSMLSILCIEFVIDYAALHLKLNFAPFNFKSCITIALYILFTIFAMSIFANREHIGITPRKTSIKEKIMLLISNSCSGSVLDIIFIFIFLFNLAWIPDTISNFLRDGEAYYRPILYIIALIIIVIIKPQSFISKKEIPIVERLVLVTGVSNIKYYKRDWDQIIISNLETVVTPFNKYTNLKKIVILLSNEILMKLSDIGKGVPENHELYPYFMEYKKDIIEITSENKMEHNEIASNKGPLIGKEQEKITAILTLLIKRCIKYFCKNYTNVEDLQFEFTSPVDYNVFQECNDKLYNKILCVMGEREKGKCLYKDENLLVNITAGTSIVSGVMTLNAIKSERGLIYTEQRPPSKLIEYDPNVIVLEQFASLTTERIQQNRDLKY